MSEVWKPVKGFEGKYEVSNTGKVRSIDRFDANNRFRKGIELKQLIESQGYYRVTLWHNKCSKEDIRVHYLVACHFIDNPENKKTVNHKDGNKLNNNLNNLEWNTYSENHLHAYKNGLKKPAFLNKFGAEHHRSKKVLQSNADGYIINIFDSQLEASRKTGISNKNISSCCNNKRYSAGGFIWRFTK